jgi:hypothetical protein
MAFILLVLLAALMIEGIGTYMSVIGLAALFASNPVIIVMAIALDVGKVVTVSFLYRNWKKVNLIMKSYMTIAALTLILITSAGVFGYLSAEFQKAIQGTSENTVLVEAMEDEKTRLQARKVEIDSQIAAIPPDFITGRRQAIEAFKDEVERINARLIVIDTELPPLKLDSIKKEVEVGPIMYIAEAFNTTPELAVKYIIMTIIFVFDPLAIALLIAGNFLLVQRQKEKEGPAPVKPSIADQMSPDWNVAPATVPVVEEMVDERPAGATAEVVDDSENDYDAEQWHNEFGGSVAEIDEPAPEIVEPMPEEITPEHEREVITRERLVSYPSKSAFDGISAKADVFPEDDNRRMSTDFSGIYRG